MQYVRPFSKYFDHTLLKPEASSKDISLLCDEARQYEFFSVCVQPHFVPLAKRLLDQSRVKVCSVVGFPLGQNLTETKAEEARALSKLGADELDMVINVSVLKENDFSFVQKDIFAVVHAAPQCLIKVILETSLLTQDEIAKATEICIASRAQFVKTSTGFGSRGASIEDVKIMKLAGGDNIEIKASGGIKTLSFAKDLIAAGATRLGSSSSVKILHEAKL